MKKIVIFFVICFTVLILTGCDPIKLLTVKAAPNTQVIIYKKGQNIEADTAKNIILVPENGTVEQQFYFGLGTWPEKAIINYSASLDSIVFYNKDGKTKLTLKLMETSSKNLLKSFYHQVIHKLCKKNNLKIVRANFQFARTI